MSSLTEQSYGEAPAQNSIGQHLTWRVVDISVASVIGVASALIYWVVAIATAGPWSLLEGLVPGLPGLLNGLWLFAGPLALVIVRKPGAGLYAEVVAGVLEAILGNQWGGMETLLIALVQGAFAEIPFLIGLYRKWSLPRTLISGLFSGLACAGYSFFTHLQAIDLGGRYGIFYFFTTSLSGLVFAGIMVWCLYKAIAKTGALDSFTSGRQVSKQTA